MTPDFPAWSSDFQRHLRRLRSCGDGQAPPLLHQFQLLFHSWFPEHLFAQEDEGPHSRTRLWPLRLTFWTFLWQVAQAGASCREAVYQAVTLCQLQGRRVPRLEDAPYCLARAALPVDRLEQIHSTLVQNAQRVMAVKDLWQGHRVYVVDGTTVIRRLMLESARHHHLSLQRISFAGALAGARRTAEAMLQARTCKLRRHLFAQLIEAIAYDQVPERPGRREPRALKRRPKPFAILTSHRHHFMETSHTNRYYNPNRRRKPSGSSQP